MRRREWKKLAEYVVHHRVELGYRDRRTFAEHVGTSERTLGNLERGLAVSSNTLAAVENALSWPPGTVERILRGEDPDLSGQQSTATRYADPHEQALWELTDLPEDTRLELIAYLRARRQVDAG